MTLFENTAEDEVRRLRVIVAKLEAAKGVRMVTVEMEPKKGFGYLFYITAPTVADEAAFGLALAGTIQQTFRKMDVKLTQAVVDYDQAAPPLVPDCYLMENAFRRWVIVKASNRSLAWSGSGWVQHDAGIAAFGGVAVSNFEMKLAAFRAAEQAGLRPALKGFRVDGDTITCFDCGRTSYNPKDVREKYCSHCNFFHERG